MTDFSKFSIKEYIKGLESKKFTVTQAVEFFIARCKKDKKNAIIEVFDSSKNLAKKIDEKIAKGTSLGRLAGVPVIIKDNILYSDHISQAASNILDGFVAPYSSTVVKKLINEDAIIIARANMDDSAMGTTGRSSCYGATLNAYSDEHVAGGSSSGSAVALACGYCLASLGSDTGGSVRLPASFNGITGIKPTYGTVSRHGVIAYGSSLEQVGVFANTPQDAQIVLSVIQGKDENDMTTTEYNKNKIENKPVDVRTVRIGRITEIWSECRKSPHFETYQSVLKTLENNGATIVDISIANILNCLPAYYVIASAEAATNLSRYDGVRYTPIKDGETIDELYKNTRSALFGTEVKRRIMLGNLMLTSGHDLSGLYKKATILRDEIKKDFANAFNNVDFILMPTSYTTAIRLDDDNTDLVEQYLQDLFTVPVNLANVPSVSIPISWQKSAISDIELPLGLQIIGKMYDDDRILDYANTVLEILKGGE